MADGDNQAKSYRGFKVLVGDESNPTFGILVDDGSKTLHICNPADQRTDWALAAATHPTLCIHSATTPATEYIKMYHDATSGYIDAVGATSIKLLVAGTTSLTLGASAFTAGTPMFALSTTNASTSASTSAEYFLASHIQSGTGGVGGRARFYTSITAALGGWSNALKAQVAYGSVGRTTGLGSAFCAELALSAGTTSGTYAALEAEVTSAIGASAGTATSFLYMNNSGTGTTVMNSANGYLFEIGAGVTDTAGGIFEAETNTDSMSMTHVLKIRISGTAYYIPLNTAKTF
uniref:Uncharacterized protein n=1 Tax=viral metagenome TaxID=1070528 RepID=A0A6M3KE13_9ZZZZ